MGIDPTSFVGLAGVPLLVALVEAIKTAWPEITARWWPLLSIAVGVLLNLGVAWMIGTSLPVGALVGLVAGMAASGLYSWVRVRTG